MGTCPPDDGADLFIQLDPYGTQTASCGAGLADAAEKRRASAGLRTAGAGAAARSAPEGLESEFSYLGLRPALCIE